MPKFVAFEAIANVPIVDPKTGRLTQAALRFLLDIQAKVNGSDLTLAETEDAIPDDTDDLAEGVANLYFTAERTDDRVAALIQNGTGITWTYNDGAGTLTGIVTLSPFDTGDLAEGSRLYFTDERAQDAVGAMINGTLVYVGGTPLLGINLSNANAWLAAQSVSVDTAGIALDAQQAGAGQALRGKHATLGGVALRIETEATNDNPTADTVQGRVATTDATVTTIGTFAVPASTTLLVEAVVVARRTGGAAGTAEDGAAYRVSACYANIAGTATIIGAASADYTMESQAAWDCAFSASGANALLRVTGAVDNNVTWHMTATVYKVGT